MTATGDLDFQSFLNRLDRLEQERRVPIPRWTGAAASPGLHLGVPLLLSPLRTAGEVITSPVPNTATGLVVSAIAEICTFCHAPVRNDPAIVSRALILHPQCALGMSRKTIALEQYIPRLRCEGRHSADLLRMARLN